MGWKNLNNLFKDKQKETKKVIGKEKKIGKKEERDRRE